MSAEIDMYKAALLAMTNEIEALKADAAFVKLTSHTCNWPSCKSDEYQQALAIEVGDAIIGLEPIAHTDHPSRHWDKTCPACNKQEPIGQFIITERNANGKPTVWEQTSFGGQPLYTSPLTYKWIGLTEEEAHMCFKSANVWHTIEAKLKEKNHVTI